ncbi:mitochondrial inner membrane peptidase complex catalytic subunit [Cladochytrium replicatum]|nr:mitochondrial inner membrane peptidase complex catalytic subunit [Cladochytrium replicatum]
MLQPASARVFSRLFSANTGRVLFWSAQGACLAILFQQHCAEISMCVGPSMLPTFNIIGDLVIVRKLSTTKVQQSVQHGDVLVAVSPMNSSRAICKRVAGLPGDTVPVDPLSGSEKLTVPAGQVWLLGDNLANSTDSRSYGPVPMGLIRGKVVCKIWPRFEWVERTPKSLPTLS